MYLRHLVYTELILDTFRYVKPMKLSVKKLRQCVLYLSALDTFRIEALYKSTTFTF